MAWEPPQSTVVNLTQFKNASQLSDFMHGCCVIVTALRSPKLSCGRKPARQKRDTPLIQVVDVDQGEVPADCGEEVGGLGHSITTAQDKPA